ncbi:TetR/AcrR family transcriptional regulator [Risungbinella massiliensis]|uniref:TetR/AcrR family transcriptional regulator n=1 Tax=Risungbinella massiliensis TaxID=1329796 RepID=UPI0005CC0C6F|nr:TetR/AcrR family transcriptional regulator [Risungbinella massiliensis]
MNNRKQQVINNAHHLFIEKGFQATSIQDILDYSGISKGTFYNYFSSKNELLIAVFKWLFSTLDKERNKVLVGKDPTDLDLFIVQVQIQMKNHHKHKLFRLFEEVFMSNDPDLKAYINKKQFVELSWFYNRFIELFGEEKKPYLLDCAIMFTSILHRNFHFNFKAKETNLNEDEVIRYSVNRLIHMVEEVSNTGEQLLDPQLLEKWVPTCESAKLKLEQEVLNCIIELKKCMNKEVVNELEQQKYSELLDFIQEELFHQPTSRKFIIESALNSLKQSSIASFKQNLNTLKQLIDSYLEEI